MAKIIIEHNGRRTETETQQGSTWAELAETFAGNYKNDILLVHDKTHGRMIELHKKIGQDAEISFVTFQDNDGRMAYARSAILILLKAIYNVIPKEKLSRVTVEFTIGGNFYIVPKGDLCFEKLGADERRMALKEVLLPEIRAKMQEYIAADLPFMKYNLPTEEAVRKFAFHGMEDKAKLFSYRRVARVNVYNLGGFEDYFYGPMCMSTRYIKHFDLLPYQDGFMLMLPQKENPDAIAPFRPSEKLFSVQNESFRWAERIGIENIADLNEAICRGDANDLILMQEAFFEKKIGEIAQIISRQDKKIILIAGPSSSGKTSTAHRLSLQLRAYGMCPHTISADDYFKDISAREFDENGAPDFESIRAVDTEQFNEDMLKLLAGEAVVLPHYNFLNGKREYGRSATSLSKDDVLIVEGIHCLNEAFSEKLPRDAKYKIYVSALTQLNIDEHNRIPTTDGRLLRRMVRDSRTRGYSAAETISRWPSVRAGEEKNIFPYQDEADVIFNTAMIYELAVIKQYAEPLLFSIPREAPEYLEARRLLKFLDYVLSVSPEIIPKTSIVREFIGGSCLDVG
ncbi:MAG: nucleoside kinase [Eubacteriales bacterium]|nr:nucleoside kinase [Eubacteriales bacterium]